jgi:hypothetical protein
MYIGVNMTVQQKMKTLVHEGPKVVGDAIRYKISTVKYWVLSPFVDISDESVEKNYGRALVAAGRGLQLQKTVSGFKSEWNRTPLSEGPARL